MSPHQILKKYFLRKQKSNPRYSMRSLARDLRVDVAFVSRLFSGKQEVPLARIGRLAKILDMDAIAEKELKKAIAMKTLAELDLDLEEFAAPDLRNSIIGFEDKPPTEKEMNVLDPWYNIAILELATCEDFEADSHVIGRRLGLKPSEVERSLSYLVTNSYLSVEGGTLIKTDQKMRLPTRGSTAIVRRFHKEMLVLAIKEMFRNTDSASFQNRLITSTSIAVNTTRIPKAKERLAQAQIEVAEILHDGKCTEVYDLSLALFPISKR